MIQNEVQKTITKPKPQVLLKSKPSVVSSERLDERLQSFDAYERPRAPKKEVSIYNSQRDESICGIVSTSTSLIIGGYSYRHGDWPWLAALFYQNVFTCGGSISKLRIQFSELVSF